MKTLLASLLFLSLAAVSNAQNTLAGNLTVQKTVTLSGAITPGTITADVNDYAPANFSTATVLRLSSDAVRSITGLAGGAAGRTLYVVNVGQYPITFSNESASSVAANRFAIGVDDYELVRGNTIGLWYDSASSRWRPTNSINAAGGGGTGTVQSVSVATANGVSGTVASSTTNPVITLSLCAITPSSVAAAGTVTGSNLSGTNTGDMANASTLLKISESGGLPLWNGGTWPGGGGGSGTGTVTSVNLDGSGIGLSFSGGPITSSGTITAAIGNAATFRSAIGAGTSNFSGAYSSLSGVPLTFAPSAHTHASTEISDSTATGRSVLTATDATAARTAIGAGTSSFSGAASSLTGSTLASNVTASSLTSAAGGTFGTAAFTASTAYDPAGSAAAITLAGLGGVPTTRTINGHALSSDVTVTASDVGAAPSSTVSFPGFGTTGTTAAVGNDSRLSDARTPLAHSQAWSTITSTPTTLSGYGITDAQPLDSDLTSIAALSTTTFGRSLLTQADAAAARTTLGAGTSSFDGTWSSLSGKPTNVVSFGSLANAAGWLYNNGAGTLSYSSPTKTTVGLGSVENTALSTWAGTANITTLGTVATGTWHGSAIADTYISSASTWNGKQAAYTNLTSFGSLANAAGWLKNNGSGTLSYSTPTKSDVGLGSVENTALSTWAGSANVTTLGTIGTGTWNATAIADGKIASALTGKTYNGLALTAAATGFTIAGGTTSKTLTVSDNATINQSVATTSSPAFSAVAIGGSSFSAFLNVKSDSSTQPIYVYDSSNNIVARITYSGQLILRPNNGTDTVSLSSSGTSFFNGGNVGIGTTSPGAPLHVSGYPGQDGILLSRSLAKTWGLSSDGNGAYIRNVTDSVLPLYIANAGGIQFAAYGAGTLITDSSGHITASSDARLKNVDSDFTRGLADLIKISPKLYHWNAKSGLDQKNQYAGLIAQNVQAAIPEAVSANKDGILSLQDRPIIAALINAVKELDQRSVAPSVELQSLHFQVRLLEAAVALLIGWNIALTLRRRK